MSLTSKPVNFDETWQNIEKTLRSVITSGEATSAEEMVQKRADWRDRFSDIYALCVASPEAFTGELYEKTMQFFQNHVEYLLKNKISNSDSTILLKDYQSNWNQYCQGSHHINALYRYLNTNFCKKKKADHAEQSPLLYPPSQSENNREIGQIALDFWKAGMIEVLRESIVKALIDSIRRDRDGEAPSQTVIHDVIRSFIDVEEYETRTNLKLYQDIFENELLTETSEYYQKEATKLLEYCDCSQYMQKVDARLEEESLRARKYLHPSSYDKIAYYCQEKLVEDQLQLLQSECREMIHNEKLTDLSRMYKLLKPIMSKGLSLMLKEFEEYIADTGLAKVKAFYSENGTGQFVDALLEIHKKYSNMIETTFNKDQLFIGARDKACTKIVNHKPSPKMGCKSPEMLAKYCDSLLKKSTKHLTELEIDDKLTNVIVIFKYIDDKDIFQKFYSKLLAKRLVHNLSVSMDSEESMINRLKVACGYEYTNKLHRMFTDMKISEDLNNKFSQFLSTNKTVVGINFSVLVLQSGAWPLSQTAVSTVSLPSELVKSVQMFETFYHGTFEGRKLTWLTHLSNGEMKMTFQKKTYIVTVTTYQMTILLLFNNGDNLSFADIKNQCQLADKELSRTLQSLIDVKLLLPTPKEVSQISECIFKLNTEFSNKRTKFKITSAVQKESVQEVEQTQSAVNEDRKMYIQATIVRIMKHSKVLKHNILMQEIITQVQSRFKPPTNMIKKCIESLIEKQYIERAEGTKDEYTYLA